LRNTRFEAAKILVGPLAAALVLATPACLVQKVTHTQPPNRSAPALDATLPELLAKIDAWAASIHTMTATVDLTPSAGSVYSGVIKEYHDVRGFILLEKPTTLRLLGQAPVVRTTIFDMVSQGDGFRLYIPSKQKFIIGSTTAQRPVKNSLENLRPQHILQALLVPAVDAEHEAAFGEKVERTPDGQRYYIVDIVELQPGNHLSLRRKVWFDRATLELSRVQFYDAGGACTEDVQYAKYQDFQGVRYPSEVVLDRPEDDYRVAITVEKAVFNQPIPPERFELKQPEGSELLDLNAPQAGDSR